MISLMSDTNYSLDFISKASLPILVENTSEENYGYPYWMPLGTCFLIKGKKNYYVVTAFHVLKNQAIFNEGGLNNLSIYYYMGSRSFLPLSKIHYSEKEPESLNHEYDYNDLVFIELSNSKLNKKTFSKSCIISLDEDFDFDKNMKFILRGYPYEQQGILDKKIINQAIKIGCKNVETYNDGTYKIKLTIEDARKFISNFKGLSGASGLKP